jgi:hypothetical protein
MAVLRELTLLGAGFVLGLLAIDLAVETSPFTTTAYWYVLVWCIMYIISLDRFVLAGIGGIVFCFKTISTGITALTAHPALLDWRL